MKLLEVTFYMRSGHQVVASMVKSIEMTRDKSTGSYAGYNIQFANNCAPSLFTLSIPDIVAVVAKETDLEE